MGLMRDLQETRQALKTSRASGDALRQRARECEAALHEIMLRLDPAESLEELRATDEWKAAAHILGWDIDWERESQHV